MGAEARPSFSWTTLVSATEAGEPDQAVIRRRLNETLDQLKPDVIAVPGWSAPSSLAAIQWGHTSKAPVIMMSESTRERMGDVTLTKNL